MSTASETNWTDDQELVAEKLKKAGVETTLVIKKGAGHGWPGLDKDLIRFADWFDEHLKKPVPGS
ncbi:MAG: hypothetical protein JO114_08745 [Planctomycetaceae bacterium]|nr:hypothetical protein [Planctomycetaceae bacterium]MBV8310433.1 hypothetical protein [Planctomycetaceae bacterium]